MVHKHMHFFCNAYPYIFVGCRLCREQWCQQIHVHRPFLFRCILPGQCTLKLITLSLRCLRRTVSAPLALLDALIANTLASIHYLSSSPSYKQFRYVESYWSSLLCNLSIEECKSKRPYTDG